MSAMWPPENCSHGKLAYAAQVERADDMIHAPMLAVRLVLSGLLLAICLLALYVLL